MNENNSDSIQVNDFEILLIGVTFHLKRVKKVVFNVLIKNKNKLIWSKAVIQEKHEVLKRIFSMFSQFIETAACSQILKNRSQVFCRREINIILAQQTDTQFTGKSHASNGYSP